MAGIEKLRQRSPRVLEEIRQKIPATKLIAKLVAHIEAKDVKVVDGVAIRMMDSSAVTAALGLLRKVLPDLAAVEHSGTVDMKPANELTDNELATIAARGSEATPAPAIDPTKLN